MNIYKRDQRKRDKKEKRIVINVKEKNETYIIKSSVINSNKGNTIRTLMIRERKQV